MPTLFLRNIHNGAYTRWHSYEVPPSAVTNAIIVHEGIYYSFEHRSAHVYYYDQCSAPLDLGFCLLRKPGFNYTGNGEISRC